MAPAHRNWWRFAVRARSSGDNLFVDLDLSAANLPPGTRLRVGAAVVEVTPKPHTGWRNLAAAAGEPLGKVLSDLVRRALRPQPPVEVDGLPVFAVPAGAALIPTGRAADLQPWLDV